MKHFLNTFKVMYVIANQRKEENIFNFDIDKIIAPLAKILVLQISFPEYFEELKNDSKHIKEWEEKAQDLFINNKEDKAISKQFLQFLWATRDTQIPDIDSFLHLKIPAYAVSLPNYSEFKEAIFGSILSKLRELIKETLSDEQKSSIIAIIRDLLDTLPVETFLFNILSSSFEIYNTLGLNENQKKELSELIIRNLTRHKKILNFDAEIVFSLINYIKEKKKTEEELINFGIDDLARMPDCNNAGKLISILYRKTNEIEEKYAKKINEILKQLSEKDPKWLIRVLKTIQLPENIEWENIKNKVPSLEILSNKLLPLINEKETEVAFSTEIFEGLDKFWDGNFKVPLSERCLHILKHWYVQSFSVLNPNIDMIIDIIINMSSWLDEKKSVEIANHLWGIYGRINELKERCKILKAYIIAAYSTANRQDYIPTIKDSLTIFDAITLEELMSFIKEYETDNDWWKKLKSEAILKILQFIQNSISNEDSVRKFDYIYYQEESTKYIEQIKNILRNVIHNEGAIEIWKEEIKKLSSNKQINLWIIEELKTASKENLPASLKGKLLDIVVIIAKESKEAAINLQIGSFIFEIAKNTGDQKLMGFGINRLEVAKELLGDTFDTKLNSETQEICGKQTNEIFQYRDLLNAYLKFESVWSDETYKLFIDALVRLINSNVQQYLDFAYSLLPNINAKKVIKSKINGLKNSLKLISNSQEKAKWEQLLKEKFGA